MGGDCPHPHHHQIPCWESSGAQRSDVHRSRALPCPHWDAVSNRFRRWERRGLWRQLWERLQTDAGPLTRQLFIDATIVRAHQHAAGALKKTAAKPHRLWAALGAACRPKSMPAVAMNALASL